jgi:SAM-dependent methyltransferase
MHVLTTFFPQWRNLCIHESSPGWDRVTQRLATECTNYTATQYDQTMPFGSVVEAPRMIGGKYRNENLEAQTFATETFDLVITQDVFEHIFRPDLAISDIARTLKPGGATIMTVPIVRKTKPSRRRARLSGGYIEHLLPAEYHGNPLGVEGSLVVMDWGYDIAAYFQHHSGMSFLMLQVDNIDLGIRADLIEVLVGFKTLVPEV